MIRVLRQTSCPNFPNKTSRDDQNFDSNIINFGITEEVQLEDVEEDEMEDECNVKNKEQNAVTEKSWIFRIVRLVSGGTNI